MSFTSIEEEIQHQLEQILTEQGVTNPDLSLKIPRYSEFGELSSNVALSVARQTSLSPMKLAEQIATEFQCTPEGVAQAVVAKPGIINFFLGPEYFYQMLRDLNSMPEEFGNSKEGNGARWLFEFVSANPTGPVNVVSARAASIGATLVSVFRKRGYQASSEYYVNDGGRQIRLLGASIRARLEQLKTDTAEAVIPEGGYHGAYVSDYAQVLQEQDNSITDLNDRELGRRAAELIRIDQERILTSFRVTFDRWFHESELYEAGQVRAIVEEMTSRGLTYTKDGALFFKASEYGDDEDRVLVKSDGDFTYVVPDIAYHQQKRERGYDIAVDLLGPDHHGAIIRMTAALSSLGFAKDFYRAIIVQQVNLKKDGAEVKMSKRAGVGITLAELIEDVGIDAARFFFLRRKISTPLDFDIDLARQHSDENPVYYVQYAHARIHSILRQPAAFEPDLNTDLSCLKALEELNVMRYLSRFPWTLDAVVRSVEPHPLTTYLTDLAKAFHLFYAHHRVISDDQALTAARLLLCKSVCAVLKQGLEIIGVEAPERM